MARKVRNLIAWTYTSDNGVDYRVNAIKGYTDQAKLGGAAALASVPPKPNYIKMRRITVRDTTNSQSRTVPVYSTDAAILTDGATVDLNSTVGGVEDARTFTVTGVHVIAEQSGRKSPTTTQAS